MRSAFCTVLILAATLALPGCKRDPSAPAPDATGAVSATASPGGGPGKAGGVAYLERLLGGATADEPLPMIVAIHGLGDRPDNFGELFGPLTVRARLILPFGEPHGDGYSWFPVGSLGNDAKLAEGTRAAADRLAAMLEALLKSRPTKGLPIVTGFSQGGMLSFTLAALHPKLVGVALPVAGLLPTRLLPTAWPEGVQKPRIVGFHGDADQRVPVAMARESIEGLQRLGFDVKLFEYPGVAHTVAPRERRDLLAALGQVTADQAREMKKASRRTWGGKVSAATLENRLSSLRASARGTW